MSSYFIIVPGAMMTDAGLWIVFCSSAGDFLKLDNWLRLVPLYWRDWLLIPRLILLMIVFAAAIALGGDGKSNSVGLLIAMIVLMVSWMAFALFCWIRLIRKWHPR